MGRKTTKPQKNVLINKIKSFTDASWWEAKTMPIHANLSLLVNHRRRKGKRFLRLWIQPVVFSDTFPWCYSQPSFKPLWQWGIQELVCTTSQEFPLSLNMPGMKVKSLLPQDHSFLCCLQSCVISPANSQWPLHVPPKCHTVGVFLLWKAQRQISTLQLTITKVLPEKTCYWVSKACLKSIMHLPGWCRWDGFAPTHLSHSK